MEKGEEGEGFVLCENPLWEKKKKKSPIPQLPTQRCVSLALVVEGRGRLDAAIPGEEGQVGSQAADPTSGKGFTPGKSHPEMQDNATSLEERMRILMSQKTRREGWLPSWPKGQGTVRNGREHLALCPKKR